MNILTFDIEEWYIEKQYFGDHELMYQKYDYSLKKILDILDENQIQATFMIVGELARQFPEVVRSIASRGHELGCHSNEHVWLTYLSEKQMRMDTQAAISSIEDVSGQKVRFYRAPAFSIGEQNKFVFEILVENGIEADSSIFPTSRDFGGYGSFPSEVPSLVKYNGIEIKEFPISVVKVLGKSIAYSGGGYFRFFPLSFVEYMMSQGQYAISYFHIGDFVPSFYKFISKELYESYFKESGTLLNRFKRSVKSNLGISKAFDKMCTLIKDIDFVSMGEALDIIEWSGAPIIEL